MAIPSKDDLIALYRKRATNYDIRANLYYLIGFREWAYRKRAIAALQLRRGDTVVEIGCGTGLNFALLQRSVGSEGRIVGVDINDAMLGQARKRVERKGWLNVELIGWDAASFEFPETSDGVLFTLAITLVPEFDEVIRKGAEALAPGRHFVILDFKRPKWPPLWLVRALVGMAAPFGLTLEMANRHPCKSLERYTREFQMQEIYFGFAYLARGQADSGSARTLEAPTTADSMGGGR